MREELLAHLTSMYDEELARLGDARTAYDAPAPDGSAHDPAAARQPREG